MQIRQVTIDDWDRVQQWNASQGGTPLREDWQHVLFYHVEDGEEVIRGVFSYGLMPMASVGVHRDCTPTEAAKIVKAIQIALSMSGQPTLTLIAKDSPMRAMATRICDPHGHLTPMTFRKEGRI